MNIYKKLLNVRKSIEVIKKQKSEKKELGYDFVSSSQVLFEIKKHLDEQNLFLVPENIETNVDSRTSVSKQSYKNGNTVEKEKTVYFTKVKMKYTWIDCDNPEDKIEIMWEGHGLDHGTEKGIGKAYSYSEKYFLLKFFNVPTDDLDPDVEANKKLSIGKTDELQKENEELKKEINKFIKQNEYVTDKYNKLCSKIKNKVSTTNNNKKYNKNTEDKKEVSENDNKCEIEEEKKELYISEDERKKLYIAASSKMLKDAGEKIDSHEIIKRCIKKYDIKSSKEIPKYVYEIIKDDLKNFIEVLEKKYMEKLQAEKKKINTISQIKGKLLHNIASSWTKGEEVLNEILVELVQKEKISSINPFDLPNSYYDFVKTSLEEAKKKYCTVGKK